MARTETQNNSDPFAGVTLATEPYNVFNDVTLATDPYDFSSEAPVSSPSLPEAGSYTQDDLALNDGLYAPIEKFMILRYGDQAVEGETREEVVNKFLNNRRGVAGGNSVIGLSELDFLREISGDDEAMVKTGQAYQIYEDMAGIFSEEATWSETMEGLKDYTMGAILDPINLVGFGIGKIAAGGGLRLATQAAKQQALKAMAKKAAEKGASKASIKKAGEVAMSNAVSQIGKQELARQGTAAATRAAMKGQGLRKLAQTSAMKELAAVTTFESIVSAGLEYGYQNSLVKTDVQEDINKFAIGLAFLGGTIIGGVQATAILRRGEFDIAMPSLSVEMPEPKDVNILGKLAESISEYADNLVPSNISWKESVEKGVKFEDLDSNFFVDMLIGLGDKDSGEVYLKGIAQIAFENGLNYQKRFEEDKYSNWIKDLILASDPQDVKSFATAWQKASGVKLKGFNKVSVKDFANTFAMKMNQSARVMNAASQGAKLNGMSKSDYQVQQLIDDALDLGLLKKEEPKSKISGITNEVTTGIQNRVIRTLVTHPSTSYLNFVGWAAQTSLGSVADLSGAILHSGAGTLKKAFGMLEDGVDPLTVSRSVLAANANRLKLLLNPDMTYEAYRSILQLRGDKLDKLSDVISGGVVDTSKVLSDSSLSPTTQLLGTKADEVIDLMQVLTLVKGQDSFTKSQEFVYQLDKGLRSTLNKSWDEVFTDPNASKILNTKEYRAIEEQALLKTLERISSKSYKGTGAVGQIAGVFEDARNIPGLGLLVPFGRFFNNTVDLTIQNTPMVPQVAKLFGGFYGDKNYSELWARSAISSAIIYSLAETEYENRKKGLAIDQIIDPRTGEISSVQYDYPISNYKYIGRIASYWFNDETVPAELITRANNDIGLGSFTRNLETTFEDLMAITAKAVSGEDDALIRAMADTGGAIGSQVISGITRPLEPINFAIGFASGSEGRLVDRKIGNDFLNKSLRYLDQITPLFTGDESVQAVGAATGPMYTQSSKMVGSRPVRLTSTERIMNILSIPTFKLNAPTSVTDKAPEAANKYNRYMFNTIEDEAEKLLKNGFSKMRPEKQKLIWSQVVSRQKKIAKTLMFLDNSGVTDTADLTFELSDKYSWSKIDEALAGISENLGEELKFENLTRGQLYVLKSWLETRDTMIMLQD